MAEEVSSIGVKLTLNASGFMSGMAAATEKTDAFVAAAKEAATVAGAAGGGQKTTSRSSAAQNMAGVPVDLSVSPASIRKLREQIISGLGVIPIQVSAQLQKTASAEAQKVVAAQVTPVIGTRSGAAHTVASNVKQNLPRREHGGPVAANQAVIVGERRPEVFRPLQSGTIHPDASRFYREQEAEARRAAAAERQHYERMSAIKRAQGGPARRGGLPRGYRVEFYSPENEQPGIGMTPGGAMPSGLKPVKKPVIKGQPGYRSPQAALFAAVKYRDQLVGTFPFDYDTIHDAFTPEMSFVAEQHRRKGLATAAYVKTEKFTGRPVMPGSTQLIDGKALWAQPNRPFGKRFGNRPLSPEDVERLANQPAPPLGGDNVGRRLRELASGGMGSANPLTGWRMRSMAELRGAGVGLREAAERIRSTEFDYGPKGALSGHEPPWMIHTGNVPPWERHKRMAGGPVRSLEERAIRMFGETDDIREAGYLTPSGRYLDFSGRSQATGYRRSGNRFVPEANRYGPARDYLGGSRNMDHREAAPLFPRRSRDYDSQAVEWMKEAGFIRTYGSEYKGQLEIGAEFSKPPTEAQFNRLVRDAARASSVATEATDLRGRTLGQSYGARGIGYPSRDMARGLREMTQTINDMALIGRSKRAMAGASVEAGLSRRQRSYTSNIRQAAGRLSPEALAAGTDWYPNAQRWIAATAARYGKPEEMVRGMTAALSAGTAWTSNKTKVLRILDAEAAGRPYPYDDKLHAHKAARLIFEGADPWSILGHTPKTGAFFLNTGGDLDAVTIDRWALRTGTRGAISQAGRGPVRTGVERGFRKVAGEQGLHPVQLQAALWIQEKFETDLAKYHAKIAAGKKAKLPTVAKYMARGGDVLSMFHGAKPVLGLIPEAFATAANWATDPFMAYMSWQGAHQSKRGDVVGKPRLARDFAGSPMPFATPDYYWQQQGPRGAAGPMWKEAMTASPYDAMRTFARQQMKSYASETIGSPRVAIPWMQDERTVKQVANWIGISRNLPGGPKLSARGARVQKERPTQWIHTSDGRYLSNLDPDFQAAWEESSRRITARYEARWGKAPEPTEAELKKGAAYRARGLTEAGGQDLYAMVGAGETTPEQQEKAVAASDRRFKALYRLEAYQDRKAKATTAVAREAFRSDVPFPNYVRADEMRHAAMLERTGGDISKLIDEAIIHHGIDPSRWDDMMQSWSGGAGGGFRYGFHEKPGKISLYAAGMGDSQHLTKLQYTKRWNALKEQGRLEEKELRSAEWRAAAGPGEPTVPQHEAPVVAAHKAVIEHVEATRAAAAEEAATQVKEVVESVSAAIPTTPLSKSDAVNKMRELGLFTRSRRTRQPEVDFEQQIGMKIPWLKRAAGGDAGNGLYIVNEVGPEAFIEGRDVSKLAARRPDIMARIPGAADGAKTGMIQKPAWSLYAPQKDGLIVRREDAHAALAATRAAGGADFADEDIQSRGPILGPGGYPIQPFIGPRVPPMVVTQAGGGARSPEMDEFAAGLRRANDAVAAFTASENRAAMALNQLRGGFTAAASGAAQAREDVAGRNAAREEAGPAEPAAAPAAEEPDYPSGHVYWTTPEGRARTAAPTGEMPPPRRRTEAARTRNWETPEAMAEMAAYRETVENPLGAPTGGSPEVQRYLRYGGEAAEQARLRRGEDDTGQERLEELRATTAGSSISGTARTRLGEVAVLSQLFGGGGMAFKRKQAELVSARGAFNRQARKVQRAEFKHEHAGLSFERARMDQAPEEVQEPLRRILAEREDTLRIARENLIPVSERLDKAEKAVLPTTAGLVKSFGSIMIGTSAYGAVFSATTALINQGAVPAAKKLIDELWNFQGIATKTTSTLGDATHQAYGNVTAVMAQTAANAGLSKSMMDFVNDSIGSTVAVKAGAAAQSQATDLFRSALGQNARGGGIEGGTPEGLYGGYGGLAGSAFLGEQMGGGKGFMEQVAGQFSGLTNQGPSTDLIGQIVGLAGQGANYVSQPNAQRYMERQATRTGLKTPWEYLEGIAGPVTGGATAGAMFGTAAGAGFGAIPGAIGGGIVGGIGAYGAGAFESKATPEQLAKREEQFKFDPNMGMTPIQLAAREEGLVDLTAVAAQGAQAMEDAGKKSAKVTWEAARSWEEIDDAVAAATLAGDEYSANLAMNSGIVMKVNGEVLKSTEDLKARQDAIEQTSRGRTVVSPEVFAQENLRQLEANREVRGMEAERQINFEIPYEVFKNVLQNPLIPASAQFGGNTARQMGATGASAGMIRGAMGQTSTAQANIQAMADEGLAAARAQIMQYSPGDLGAYNEQYDAAQKVSDAIAGLTRNMLKLNAEASRVSWANQIRLANRGLQDALTMQGKANTSRLGALQREQWLISRASQQLSLQLQQRQITTQVALAGFQAPGETGEERYMRQKEKLAEADIAQRQLDFSFKEFTVSGSIWKENLQRAVTDARASLNVMQTARNAELYAIQSQQAIAARSQELAAHVGKMDAIMNKARGNFTDVLQAAASGIGKYSGKLADAFAAILTALGYGTKKPRYPGKEQDDQVTVPGATGLLGMTMGPTNFLAGEVKGEAVAVLKDPRMSSFAPDAGASMGSPTAITVNINGAVVRGEQDISSLARAVADEVERRMARKGQLLGLRTPAY